MFYDASQHAYATAAFLRVETEADVNTKLVQAKTRVAPLKKKNLIKKKKKKKFRILRNNTAFWSDSMTVLAWIESEDQVWNIFDHNRVMEIRKRRQ